jgi:antitoxin component of MazEF toxin-antitoxin module
MNRWKNVFVRKAFKCGNSLAIRIPKELAEAVNLREADIVDFEIRSDKQVAIRKVDGQKARTRPPP